MLKLLAKILLIGGGLYLPMIGIWCLFGWSGSNPTPFIFIFLGHLVFLIFTFKAIKNPKYFIGAAVGALIFIWGYHTDKMFWRQQNANTCAKLRADPYCIESKFGFTCKEPSSLGNFSTDKGICNLSQ